MTAVAFSHLKFPDYEFREYPKWVKDAEGKDVLVETRAEELTIRPAPATLVNKLVQVATETEESGEGEGTEESGEGEGTEESGEGEGTEESGEGEGTEESGEGEGTEEEAPQVEEPKARGRRRKAA